MLKDYIEERVTLTVYKYTVYGSRSLTKHMYLPLFHPEILWWWQKGYNNSNTLPTHVAMIYSQEISLSCIKTTSEYFGNVRNMWHLRTTKSTAFAGWPCLLPSDWLYRNRLFWASMWHRCYQLFWLTFKGFQDVLPTSSVILFFSP